MEGDDGHIQIKSLCFELTGSGPVHKPLDPGFMITEDDLHEKPDAQLAEEYSSLIESIGYPVRGVVPGDRREGHFNVSEENNGRTAVGGPLMLVLYVGEEDVGCVVCLETRLASQASEH